MTSAAKSDDAPSLRINLDPEDVGRGLAQIVVVILDVLRELLERKRSGASSPVTSTLPK